MSRTALISAGLPKGLWDKASDAMAYTKNRVPHKTLQGKTPIEVFLQKDPIKERANLRPFGQKVICYDYEVTDKLSARSYEARIIGYTQTFGTYWVRKNDGSYKLTKSPTPVIEESESDTDEEPDESRMHQVPKNEEPPVVPIPENEKYQYPWHLGENEIPKTMNTGIT